MKRRALLQLLASAATWLPLAGVRLRAQPGPISAEHATRLHALADAVLPQAIGEDGRQSVVAAFQQWLAGYRAGAELEAGYGFPRLRRAGPTPFDRYSAQLDALETEARASGRGFADLPRDARQALVRAAIDGAKVERLPARPTGGHIAADLMAFYFASSAANDLCYEARIGRGTCRTLTGSVERPAPLAGGR
jgi:hypothetical protein